MAFGVCALDRFLTLVADVLMIGELKLRRKATFMMCAPSCTPTLWYIYTYIETPMPVLCVERENAFFF